jgi:hypothetical protein
MTDEKFGQQDGTEAVTSLPKQFISVQASVLQKQHVPVPICGDIQYALFKIYKVPRTYVCFVYNHYVI